MVLRKTISALISIVGRGGALVEMMTFNRRVVGSTPSLATTFGSWASPPPAIAYIGESVIIIVC